MNTIDQDQSDQSRRTEGATQSAMGWGSKELNVPSIDEIAARINGTPLPSKDANGRTDAASLPPASRGARIGMDVDEMYKLAVARLGKGRALTEYLQGVSDGLAMAKSVYL